MRRVVAEEDRTPVHAQVARQHQLSRIKHLNAWLRDMSRRQPLESTLRCQRGLPKFPRYSEQVTLSSQTFVSNTYRSRTLDIMTRTRTTSNENNILALQKAMTWSSDGNSAYSYFSIVTFFIVNITISGKSSRTLRAILQHCQEQCSTMTHFVAV